MFRWLGKLFGSRSTSKCLPIQQSLKRCEKDNPYGWLKWNRPCREFRNLLSDCNNLDKDAALKAVLQEELETGKDIRNFKWATNSERINIIKKIDDRHKRVEDALNKLGTPQRSIRQLQNPNSENTPELFYPDTLPNGSPPLLEYYTPGNPLSKRAINSERNREKTVTAPLHSVGTHNRCVWRLQTPNRRNPNNTPKMLPLSTRPKSSPPAHLKDYRQRIPRDTLK